MYLILSQCLPRYKCISLQLKVSLFAQHFLFTTISGTTETAPSKEQEAQGQQLSWQYSSPLYWTESGMKTGSCGPILGCRSVKIPGFSEARENYFAYTDMKSKGWRNFQKKQATWKPPHLGKSVGLAGLRVWHLITASVTFSAGFLGALLNVNANYQSTMCLQVQLYLPIMLLRS